MLDLTSNRKCKLAIPFTPFQLGTKNLRKLIKSSARDDKVWWGLFKIASVNVN